jgi:hypothetical protein
MLVSKRLLRWNRDLELVVKDDTVRNTDVPELIVHALQPMKMNERVPNGFSEFIACLRVLGLDSQYVENEYAIQVLDGLDSSSSSSDSDTSGSDADSDNEEMEGENQDEEGGEEENQDEEGGGEENQDEEGGEEENQDQDEGEEENDVEMEGEKGEMGEKVEWLNVHDDVEVSDDEAEDDDVEEKPEGEWLEMDNQDGDVDDIYINSAGYYKRV